MIGLRPSRAVARSVTAAPARLRRAYAIPLPPHFACFLLEARKHAKCYVVGEIHRSTPCRVGMPRAIATLRHEACVDAHDVPLRGW